MHARVDRLSLAPKLGDSQNHLLERDVAIAIAIKSSKALLGLFLPSRSHDLDHILRVQFVLAFNNEREPDTPRKGFGRFVVVQGLEHDGVSRVGIKDLLAGHFLSHSSERAGDLVPHAAHIL